MNFILQSYWWVTRQVRYYQRVLDQQHLEMERYKVITLVKTTLPINHACYIKTGHE